MLAADLGSYLFCDSCAYVVQLEGRQVNCCRMEDCEYWGGDGNVCPCALSNFISDDDRAALEDNPRELRPLPGWVFGDPK